MPFQKLLRLARIPVALIFPVIFYMLPSASRMPVREIVPGLFAIHANQLPPWAVTGRRVAGTPLRLEGAWELTGTDTDFGGLSSLWVEAPSAMAITDNGAILRWQMEGARWPAALSGLPEGCRDRRLRIDRDSESLVTAPDGHTQWLGIEARNVLCRVQADGSAVQTMPPAMRNWPRTGGSEAMARLRDGRFLVFQEGEGEAEGGLLPALLFDREPLDPGVKAMPLQYHPPQGYRPVDAALLPDGRLLVLNRRFSLPFAFAAKLVLIERLPKEEGGIIEARELAWLGEGDAAENWEALAVEDQGQGRATIWIASDNNFLPIQKTLLIKLAWNGAGWPRGQ